MLDAESRFDLVADEPTLQVARAVAVCQLELLVVVATAIISAAQNAVCPALAHGIVRTPSVLRPSEARAVLVVSTPSTDTAPPGSRAVGHAACDGEKRAARHPPLV